MPRLLRHGLSIAASWALAFTLVGYPVAGLIGSALNWDSLEATTPYRVSILLLSGTLFVLSSRFGAWFSNSPWLLIFMGVYFLRLSWDVGIAEVPGAADALIFFVLTVAIPATALGHAAGQLREVQASRSVAVVGGLACSLAVAMYFSDWGIYRSLTEATQRLSFEAVNPISLGHAALSTVIAAFTLLRGSQFNARGLPVVLIGVVALICLALTASRGPLLAFGACFFAYLLIVDGWRKKLLWTGIAAAIAAFAFMNITDESRLVQLFVDFEADESIQQRLTLQTSAIGQFLANPLFGSAFIELDSREYPHNLFVETAMALGLVGLLAVCALVLLAGIQAFRLLSSGQILLPLLWLQYFIAIQLSGSLWGSVGFWAMTAVVLGLPQPSRKASKFRWKRLSTESARINLQSPSSGNHS